MPSSKKSTGNGRLGRPKVLAGATTRLTVVGDANTMNDLAVIRRLSAHKKVSEIARVALMVYRILLEATRGSAYIKIVERNGNIKEIHLL